MHLWVTKIKLRFYIDENADEEKVISNSTFCLEHLTVHDLHTFSGFSKNERFSINIIQY